MTALRDYTRGLRTQAEVARELGISVRTLQRIEDEAVAWWLLCIARAMREAIDDYEQAPRLPRRFACRISEIAEEHRGDAHAPHADFSPELPSDGSVRLGRRAGHLPRRFPRKP